MRPRIAPFFLARLTPRNIYRSTHGQKTQQDEVRASIDGQVQAKRSGSKPLMAEAASVRTAKPSTSMSSAPNGKRPTSPFNPALTVATMMGRVMGAYAELPARLSRRRSPIDIWFEQARFMQRVFGESTAPADRPSRVASR